MARGNIRGRTCELIMTIQTVFQEYPIGGTTEEKLYYITQLRDEDINRLRNMGLVINDVENKVRKDRVVSSATTLRESDGAVFVDTSGGSVTVTLPATPRAAEYFRIGKLVAANTLTIDGNGNNINGTASQNITSQYNVSTVQYIEDLSEWILY